MDPDHPHGAAAPLNVPDLLDVLDVMIVGAGFSGLYMLYRARQAGLRALVVEAAPSVGGTWYHNRYPNARVDIQSLEYSYSFDEALQQEWHWTERYASQPELLRYANHVADRFGLRDGILLNTRLASAAFDEAGRCWRATGDGGQAWSARFIVLATGPLSTPHTPAFPGLDRFQGPVIHTARWPEQPIDFSGQSVAVVGTGSSGLQVIPSIARQARALTVFQRTAAYVVPAHNGPLDAAQEARVKADYAGFRARNRMTRTGFGCEIPPRMVSALSVSSEEREAVFEERWRIGGFSFLWTFYDIMLDLEANALAAEFVRGKIRQIVTDPATARLLCPTQPIGCKRLGVDSVGYYETYNRPNVRLVDVGRDDAIAEITPTGLRTRSGEEHRFDTLVLATGFDAVTGTMARIDVRGRGGLTIKDKWAPGPLNNLGLTVAGFPNLFLIASAGSPTAFTSVVLSIEHHADWIASCITWMNAHGHRTIETTAEAEAAWGEHVDAMAARTVYLRCDSWYLGANIPGKPRRFMALAGGFPAYAQRCAEIAAAGYPGFAFG